MTTLQAEQLPADVQVRLLDGETIHHFAFVDPKAGGCGSPPSARQWLLVTDQRIVFEGSVRQARGTTFAYTHQSGSIPLQKVSFIGVGTEVVASGGCGCSATPVTHLSVNSSGGEIVLAIPTKQEADRIQRVVDTLLSKEA